MRESNAPTAPTVLGIWNSVDRETFETRKLTSYCTSTKIFLGTNYFDFYRMDVIFVATKTNRRIFIRRKFSRSTVK